MDVQIHGWLYDRVLLSFAPKMYYKVLNSTARRQSNMDFDYNSQKDILQTKLQAIKKKKVVA